MKKALILLTSVSILSLPLNAQETPEGMAVYTFGKLLRTSDAPQLEPDRMSELQMAHLKHLESMEETGLVAAGPVVTKGELAGLLFFLGEDLEAHRSQAMRDPMIQAGQLRLEMHPWWGPAGIGEGYRKTMEQNPNAAPGMVRHQVAFLYRGDSWTPGSTPETQELQRNHLAHIGSMAESGALVAAGPFSDGGDLRGIFVFRMASLDEARALAAQDPAVKAGRLRLEFIEWLCAEGVMPGK